MMMKLMWWENLRIYYLIIDYLILELIVILVLEIVKQFHLGLWN